MVRAATVIVIVIVWCTWLCPNGSGGVFPLDLRKDGLNVGDGGGLAVGELASGALVVIAVVLVFTVVVLVVVLVAGIVLVDELEHAHDDGASLGTGHVLLAVELTVGHTSDDAGGVAHLDGHGTVQGNAGPILDLVGDLVHGCSGRLVCAAIDGVDDVLGDISHVVAVHSLVVDGHTVGQVLVRSYLGVGPVPGRTCGLGLGGGLDVAVVERTGNHGDPLDVRNPVIRSERSVLETCYDAQLCALGYVVVVPGVGPNVLELGDQGEVLVGEDGVGGLSDVSVVVSGGHVGVVVGGNVLSGLGVLPGAAVVEEDDAAVSGLVADGTVVVGVVDEERAVGDDPIVAGAAGISRERGDDQGEAHDQRHEQGENAGIELTHSVPSFHNDSC